MSDSRSWTAPLKRNWKPGKPQISAFLRTASGGTVSLCHDEATDDEQQLVLWLVVGVHKMSPKLKEKLKTEWENLPKG